MEKKHFEGKRECMMERKRDGEWGSDPSLWQKNPRPRGRQDLCYHLKH